MNRKTVRLTASVNRDLAWAGRFHKDTETYLDQNKKWMKLCYGAHRARTVDGCKAARVKARTLLVAGREQAQLDELREMYDADLQTHDNDEEWMVGAAKKREEFYSAASDFPSNWEAKKLDGGTFRLADQRGKVLVLFFWSIGCEYCVLAAPQIRKLAADYEGKGAAVVGMHLPRAFTDDERAQAERLIAKAYQGFPHVEAKEIPALYRLEHYGLEGDPSILIVDQSGKVHDVHLGYAADMGQYIRKVVDGLLGESSDKD
jgi:thiol-disulfide isomerase/thioredoxin